MALSFKESREQLSKIAATPMRMSLSNEAAVYGVERWIIDDKYTRFNNCRDEKVSVIDENKNITIDPSQINLSQEINSQFITFEMRRYYDGFDLTDMAISIHYIRSDKTHGSTIPVNVEYNDEKIRFTWKVDDQVTCVVGNLKFEIHADGLIVDNTGMAHAYRWKSRVTEKFNILPSLCGDGCEDSIVITNNWVQDIVTSVTEKVADKVVDAQISEQVSAAESYAAQAEASALEAASAAQNAVEDILINGKYATEEYVNEAVADIDVTKQLENYALKSELPTKVSEFENDAGYLTEHQSLEEYALKADIPSIEGLATEEYVQKEIAKVDVSEQLVDYALKSEIPSIEGLATEEYVAEAVAAVDVSGQLADYVKSEDVYTKSEVDTKTDTLSSSIDTNIANITSLSGVVGELQTTINGIDTSPRLTYDVKYNDTEDEDVGENVFALYEITNEGKEDEVREIKQKFTIVGGSGGSTSSSMLKIGYVTTSPLVVTINDSAVIKYTFSGTDSSGDAVTEGTATWKVAGQVVATDIAVAGENSFDITDYITIGTQKVNLTIVDDAGSLVSKNWTVQKIDVRLESTFNDKLTYPIGTVSFDYTPYGAISKDVHFILDGKEIGTVTTSASGVPAAYSLPVQEHGAHLLEVYMTAVVNGNSIESNHIYKDIIWYDENSDVPVISTIYQDFTAMQYDATNIEYVVYDPKTETPTVTRAVDGVEVSTSVLNSNSDVWQYKTSEVGKHTLTITCGETVKTLTANIEKLDIDVEPVIAGLVFDFNPSGKSNSDADRLWSYDNGNNIVSMTVSDNFDWVNGGYQIDDNGDQYFCIKAGNSVDIDYKLFEDDAKKNGKEFKLIFKSANVQSADANFLSCVDNTTEDNHIGIEMNVHEAYVYGQAGKLHLPYSEEDIIEFEFNISKDTEAIPMVMGYEDGVSTCPMVYTGSHNFTQTTPKTIKLGSDKCDLHIYRFKVYNTSLNARGILNNFIADARNAEEIIARHKRNQIYNENQELTPEILAEKCPQLRVIMLEVPYFTNSKDEKVGGTTIRCIYKNGDPVLDNWIATDCVHAGQGTSSNNYGASGRNLDLIMKTYKDYGNNPVITLGDGKTTVNKVSLSRNSVDTNYFNIKVNIASSENANNSILAKRYNEFNPYERPFVREDVTEIPKIKDTMEFQNCVVFIKETDPTVDAQGNYTTHREFNDTNWHYYAFGNIGDSKKTDGSRLTDPDDRYECINEILDVDKALSAWPNDELSMKILEAEKFNGKTVTVDGVNYDASYEWRYIWEDGTDEENDEVAAYCKQKWIEMYDFVVNSTDEDFKAHLGDYFVLDSAFYYYLFTTRYTLVDNRSKNLFLHYGKTGGVDADGNPIRKWDLSMAYDLDTSLGINNFGDMVYRYGYEDTDVADGTSTEVFRVSNSTFFCRLRDNFGAEMAELYRTLESKNAWHAESLISEFDAWQNQFPEELWRVDIERKYIRTYNSSFINGAGDPQFLENMANGRKKYQRRQYERDQEQYMASKYQTTLAFSDSAVLRCEVPEGDLVVSPNYKFKLTPYAYMYLNVQYGNGSTPIQLRAEPNVEYEIPFEGTSADIVNIYSASMLKSLGDLSTSYPATVSAPTADKLTQLLIGNKTEGYDNSNLTSVTLGANDLLEELNLANVSSFNQSLDLSALKNLRKLYAQGSSITGVVFADGGKLEEAELPAIGSLNIKNLIYLKKLDVTSWDKLTNLTVENCPTISLVDIINSAANLSRIRLVGVDWTFEDTTLLDRLYAMKGIDKNGYNIDQSVIAGNVHIPVIKEKQLADYNAAWPDLNITYNTLVQQFSITFVNDDGTVLDVQYVDKGTAAVDPLTRAENPITTPIKESSVSTDYTFVGWDKNLVNAFENQVITATYSESARRYTIKYVSKTKVEQETTTEYGSTVLYNGETPVYTLEESAYKYYLFDRWDQSGYVNGNKTINAVYDSCEYKEGYFIGKDIKDMRPVEIYMMTKLASAGVISLADYIEAKDSISIQFGNDFSYEDVEEKTLIPEKTVFTGNNYVDTGIQLLSEDRDFVLAIDCEVSDKNANGAVLAQCFSGLDTSGFRLAYNNGVKLTWGSSSASPLSINGREMLVIRHRKGENGLHVYSSNVTGDASYYVELDGIHSMMHNVSLVFGCSKLEDGSYEQHATGIVYWSKLWYADLGDEACSQIAYWPHEEMRFEVCCESNGSLKRYYLSDNSGSRSSMTFIASNVLSQPVTMSAASTNAGGWAQYPLNSYLNNRVYKAFPEIWRQLMQQVKIRSSIGVQSTEISNSDCYIFIPSISELDPSITSEPYASEGTIISHLSSNEARICKTLDGESVQYWTRSPSANWDAYVYSVLNTGSTQPVTQLSKSEVYARIMISI